MTKRRKPRHIIHKARKWKKMLEKGDVRSLSDIAKIEGLTPARVTQIMNLLRLPDYYKKFLISLRDPKDIQRYSERRLRRCYSDKKYSNLPLPEKQKYKRKLSAKKACKRNAKRSWNPSRIRVTETKPLPPENLEILKELVKKAALRKLKELQEKRMEELEENLSDY